MTPQVQQAIEELRGCFPDAEVVARGTDGGGAIVKIDPIDLGSAYAPRETWMGFAISFQYPQADIYPLFVRPDLSRVDGRAHGQAITLAQFEGEPALQLSRSSNGLNPEVDTAALKVTKVVRWLRDQ